MGDFLADIVANAMVPSGRGRRAQPLEMTVLRELEDADIALLANPGKPQLASALTRLRASHHTLAQLLGQGTRPGECAMITGYSVSRISVLQSDPAFKELMEYYKQQQAQVYINVHERLAAMGIDTLEELQRRLDEEPEKFTARELMEFAALCMDRSNAPPKGGKGALVVGGGNGVSINITFVDPPEEHDAPLITLENDG